MQIRPQNQQLQVFIEELYEEYKKPLLKTVYKYTGNYNECEDVIHEIFIRIIRNAEMLYTFPKPKMEAYIFLIVKGVSFDYLRKKYKSDRVDISDDSNFDLLLEQKKQNASTFDAFEKINLALLLKEIPSEEQLLLIGKYYLGMSINELVSVIGGTPTSVRSKLHRVRKKVFQEWSQSGLNMEDFING